MTRERLPDRRVATSCTATGAGPHASDGSRTAGRLKSLSKGRRDSPLLALARDAAILASMALQYGAPAAVIHHALAGREIGPLAEAFALIDGFSASSVTLEIGKETGKNGKGNCKGKTANP